MICPECHKERLDKNICDACESCYMCCECERDGECADDDCDCNDDEECEDETDECE
jgi:hypothetical protein